MPHQPTAATEFRRGVNGYNLTVGLIASLALGGAVLLATATGVGPDLLGRGAEPQAAVAALALFVVITAIHTAVHTYLGWRFDRGIRAATAGDYPRAVRLLIPVTRPGLDHYDPDGTARHTLESSRAEVQRTARRESPWSVIVPCVAAGRVALGVGLVDPFPPTITVRPPA